MIKKTPVRKKYTPNSKEKYMCGKHKKFFTEELLNWKKDIIKSNNEHLNWTVQQILMLKNDNNLNKIYLVGAAFKEDTDDLRNSPTLDIYKIFEKIGEEVTILDTKVIVPDHNFINSINEIDSESLIAVMYPLKDQLSVELKNFASENNCIIYYPWN